MEYCQLLFPSLDASKTLRHKQSVVPVGRLSDTKQEMVYLLNTSYSHSDASKFTTPVGHLDTDKPFDFMLLVLRGMVGAAGEHNAPVVPAAPSLSLSELDLLAGRVARLEVKSSGLENSDDCDEPKQ